ncbi:hypothetical protein B9Z19DRAFT_1133290 [Tuber borchii]|uniref:Uncharacterized protein n=1 Tax=Tuber borchii TaxID=42251 RepID=A0A2T6ZG26_TUBBO|nr:hypothetical protein B9Z19DRAFT_1133290 [Tuber borchii]
MVFGSVRNGPGARAAPQGNCQEDWTGPDDDFSAVPSQGDGGGLQISANDGGDLTGSAGICRHLWASVGICGHLWASVGICGHLSGPTGILSGSV